MQYQHLSFVQIVPIEDKQLIQMVHRQFASIVQQD
jgi:hypothetical protein